MLFLTERDALDASGCPGTLDQAIIHQSQRLHDAELVGRPAHHSEKKCVVLSNTKKNTSKIKSPPAATPTWADPVFEPPLARAVP